METAKPRAPLELRLVEIDDPALEDAANAPSAADPAALESVTLQPFSDRRPKPAVPPRATVPLDTPSVTLAVDAAAAPTSPSAPGALGVSDAGPMAAATVAGTSRFLDEATREYEAGRIDQPLWMRAAAQAGGDENVARESYLRARATALKLAQREHRGDLSQRAGVSGASNPARIGANLASRAITGDEAHPRARTRKYVAIAAGVACAAAAAAWWFGGSDSGPPREVATAAPPAAAAGTARAPAVAAQPTQTAPEDHAEHFGSKVAELKGAGNWNVLVLFASEWTRKQPENATAWKELAIGYSNMRQMDDALQAATTATQLAPQDPAAWRLLAQVNVALDQPAAALVAFAKAATLDDGDLTSGVQVGILSTQLDRFPDARAAFDKVLLASPDHIGALCGKAQLAQKSKQPREAEVIARQLKAVDGRCREADPTTLAATVPTVTGAPVPRGAPAPHQPVAGRAR